MCFHPDGIGHNLHRLIIGNLGNIINQSFHIIQLQGQLVQLFFLFLNDGFLLLNRLRLSHQLLLLLGKNEVLLFQILATAVLRLLLQLQSVLPANIEQQSPAGGIIDHFSVVVATQLLVRLRQFKAKGFQSFLLLGTKLPVLIFTVKDMTFMDVRRAFINVQCPVQNVDMGAEASFQLRKKFRSHQKEGFRRSVFLHLSDLEQTFLRAGLFIFQDFICSAVALRVSVLFITGILSVRVIRIMGVIINLLDFFKSRSQLNLVTVLFCQLPITVVAVPVDVVFGSLLVNVLAVAHIKITVIVLGIVNAILSGTTVVFCQFQTWFLRFLKIFPAGGGAAKLLPCCISAPSNTQY